MTTIRVEPERFMQPLRDAAWAIRSLDSYGGLALPHRQRLAREALILANVLAEKARDLAPDGRVEFPPALPCPGGQAQPLRAEPVYERVGSSKRISQRILAALSHHHGGEQQQSNHNDPSVHRGKA